MATMIPPTYISDFLGAYAPHIQEQALMLRHMLLERLPDISEQVDLPAKMMAYTYGKKYKDVICVIIPSKQGLKLGFNRGVDLPDPFGQLQGSGKISRYVVIKSVQQIESPELATLVASALAAYTNCTS